MSQRKTKEQKIREGTFRPDRNRAAADPSGRLVMPPPPPEDLKGLAAEVWNEAALDLVRNQVLHESELRLLKLYCMSYETYHRLTLLIQKEGETYKSGDLIKAHPAAKMRKDEFDQLMRLGNYFYLTPKSRASMPPVEGQRQLDWLDWLNAPDYDQYPEAEDWIKAHQYDHMDPIIKLRMRMHECDDK